jgi:hypothetical protein
MHCREGQSVLLGLRRDEKVALVLETLNSASCMISSCSWLLYRTVPSQGLDWALSPMAGAYCR